MMAILGVVFLVSAVASLAIGWVIGRGAGQGDDE